MKTILFLLLLSSAVRAQNSTYPIFTSKAFAKATTATDTSSLLYLPYNSSWANIVTTTTGSDSSKIYVNVDAYVNGLWNLSVIRDTVTLGRPAGHNSSLSKGQIESYFIRTSTSDLVNGTFQLRIRNVHASGSSDSTSALTYTQQLQTRQ